ncbi:MAG: ATP-binding protein [Acidobacteriota bacterium]|nr:ATP-binding protein [Blastocatellia bacterium]MDW8412582.1 ATP-binding protein [Acidobacteriota bacterium]
MLVKKRRSNARVYRIVTLALATSVFVLISSGYLQHLLPRPEPGSNTIPSDTLLLYALTSVNFIVTLVLLTILARNLLKLRQERFEERLGSKFKTKMVVFSIGISLLPGALLFFFAYGLLNSSLDLWFSSPTSRFLESADLIKRAFIDREMSDLIQTTRTLMRATGLRGRSDSRGKKGLSNEDVKLLKREYLNQKLVFLQVVIGDREQLLLSNDLELGNAEAAAETAKGRSYKTSIAKGNRTILFVGVPILEASRPIGAFYAARELPKNLADSFREIDKSARDRDALVSNARRVKVTNLYLLAAMTLLLIFAATWTALHVARSITVPIQALAEATRAVTLGDYDARVRCQAEDDELATLIDSFNQMAAQLSENKRTLELAASHQLATNRALEERKRYIETILESLSTGIISLDSSHSITTYNRSALQILGWVTPPSVGMPVEQLFPQQNQSEILRLVRRARRLGHVSREIDLQLERQVHAAVTITTLRDIDGKYLGSVLMIEDVSELIEAQRSAVWSEVARRMAHEIKNPLTPIQLSAERIAKHTRKISHRLDDRYLQMVEECTQMIKQEVTTLKRMVDEFSSFARLPQAQLQIQSLNEVVLETVKLYDERLEGIELRLELQEELPQLNLDREQIKRALVNLIDNAVEATEGVQGERAISVVTRYKKDSETVILEVADTGHGIPLQDRERLFQPYFSTRKRGTGLGLAIVSHIVSDHSARIRMEDNLPRGTRFIIELPVPIGVQSEVLAG